MAFNGCFISISFHFQMYALYEFPCSFYAQHEPSMTEMFQEHLRHKDTHSATERQIDPPSLLLLLLLLSDEMNQFSFRHIVAHPPY